MDIKVELSRFNFEKMIEELAKNLEGYIDPENIVSVEGEKCESFPALPTNEDITAFLENQGAKVFITYALRYASEAIVSGDGRNWSEEQNEAQDEELDENGQEDQEVKIPDPEDFEGEFDSIGITFTSENKILTIKTGAYIAEENSEPAEILDPDQDELDIFDDAISEYVWKFMKMHTLASV